MSYKTADAMTKLTGATGDVTYFDTMVRDFKDVSIDGEEKINTTEFLEAAESLVKLFDLLESTAFGLVQSDMNGNITKIRKRQLKNPDQGMTLQEIVLSEVKEKKKDATQGLLWLTRGLNFTATAIRKNVTDKDQELADSFSKAYTETLSKHHGYLIRPVFKLAMSACPYRKAFYEKLGGPSDKLDKQVVEWLEALEQIVIIIVSFLDSGNYAKGL